MPAARIAEQDHHVVSCWLTPSAMRPTTLPFLMVLLLACSSIFAQDPAVVRSAGVEMQPATARPALEVVKTISVTGEHDVPPAHADCKTRKGQERLDCTNEHLLGVIRKHLGPPAFDLDEWGDSIVAISFSLNQYGEVKNIRVEHKVDGGLAQPITVALYSASGFAPAMKDGAAVHSALQLNYRYADLFR
jgi:hypothetical protein